MYKTLWSIFWGCILVQILWWSAGHNEAFTIDLIERERVWQIQYLGFDLVERVNQLLVGVEQFLSTSPIPSGDQASLEYSEHFTDSEVQGAVSRILAIPYLQADIRHHHFGYWPNFGHRSLRFKSLTPHCRCNCRCLVRQKNPIRSILTFKFLFIKNSARYRLHHGARCYCDELYAIFYKPLLDFIRVYFPFSLYLSRGYTRI